MNTEPEWIEWKGGECPVPPETRVDVKNGRGWVHTRYPAESWNWGHRGNSWDIVAYRVVSPEPLTPQPTGIEAQVCRDIAARQAVGLKKYGITIADNPAGRVERIRHAYEEACDLCVYLRWELSKAEGEEQP